ncbi:MAG TPA: hypothetical protein ENK19_04850, partial [Acidobacteria bacterium]|nr:hypothetical protein [Acidobacteriota bacterium]
MSKRPFAPPLDDCPATLAGQLRNLYHKLRDFHALESLPDDALGSQIVDRLNRLLDLLKAITEAREALKKATENVLDKVPEWAHPSNPSYIDGSKLYPHSVGGSQIKASQITAYHIAADAVTASEIKDGEIQVAHFASGIRPVQIVSSLPALPNPNYPNDSVVFCRADGKLYRNVNSTWTAEVPAGDITGQLGSAQIAAGAILADHLAANSVIAGKIAAGAVSTDQLAANAITSDKIKAGAIGTDQLAAGAVVAEKIAVAQLAAITAYMGTLILDEVVSSSNFAEPTGTAQGAGFRLSVTDGLEVYGSSNVFGGPTFFNDGSFLVTIGLRLNDTATSKRYPSKSDFTTASKIHLYQWTGTEWNFIGHFGQYDTGTFGACTLYSEAPSGSTQKGLLVLAYGS